MGVGGDVWSSDTPWCFMLLQSRYALTVQALWLVLSISSPIHGRGLPSNPKRGRGWSCYIPFLLLHTSPIKISSCCAGPLACFKYLSCPGEQTTIQSIKGRGGGGGVVMFTPWCFMLHHCFPGPLACFRCIFWNVENELISLWAPPPPWTQEIIWVIDTCTVLTSQCGTQSKHMQKGVFNTLLAKDIISVKFT